MPTDVLFPSLQPRNWAALRERNDAGCLEVAYFDGSVGRIVEREVRWMLLSEAADIRFNLAQDRGVSGRWSHILSDAVLDDQVDLGHLALRLSQLRAECVGRVDRRR